MADAPELTTMTRRRTVRPLLAAWVLVIAILGVGIVWLSLSDEGGGDAHKAGPESGQTTHDGPSAASHEIAIADLDISANRSGEVTPPDEGARRVSAGLVKAPIDGLVITGANGPLPVLGPDKLVAWKAYARPDDKIGENDDDRPKIAIIVIGIGLNSRASSLAISRLPGQVDMGFSPYGHQMQKWMDKAREAGHEGFLMIPTEPLSYPENDPGPHTLLTGATPRDNLKKLDWLLSRLTGYVGVVNEMGSKFTTSEKDLLPVLEDLKGRGLMLLDSRATRFSVAARLARRISMPRAFNNRYIDNKISAKEIAANLAALENTARSFGVAIGVARAIPLTIREIEKWAEFLDDRGIRLVPVTAIANRQPLR